MACLSFAAGFYAIWSHKAISYDWFNNFLLISILSKVLVSYLNVLNLLVFIMKIITYMYARFVLSVLHTVLVIPQRRQEVPNEIENIEYEELQSPQQ